MKLTTVLAAVAAAVIMLAPVTASARHHNNHGWRPHHGWHNHWRHGMIVPFGWRHYAWVDWHRRHLHDPGRYHWVFIDDQYVLVDDRGFIIEIYGG